MRQVHQRYMIHDEMSFRAKLINSTIGRSLMIVPRSVVTEGFMDVDRDDYKEEGYLKETQETQLAIIEDKWLDGYKVRVYKE
jgi:hypothetical protein